MTTTSPHRFMHVTNGTCTTALLDAAGIAGKRSLWADPLYEGPVPGGLSDDDLLDVRIRFHQPDTGATAGAPHPADDPANDMRRWRATIADSASYDELVLWFEHDLFDQLNLIQLLSWIRARLPASTRVSLICIGAFHGRAAFMGLGELTPPELASLLETRRVVRGAESDLAERVWRAFREPSPVALDALRGTDTSALPFLAQALARFLQEYPWARDGLSRSERHLMQLADGGITLEQAFHHMHEGEPDYHVTDRSLAALADDLCDVSPPLLMRDGFPAAGHHVLRGSVTLTETGRAVLDGRIDRVTVCGIDRWLGGVHLHRGAALWRWDDRAERVTRE